MLADYRLRRPVKGLQLRIPVEALAVDRLPKKPQTINVYTQTYMYDPESLET